MKNPILETLRRKCELSENLEALRKRLDNPVASIWTVISFSIISIQASYSIYRSKEPEPFEYIACSVMISLTLHQLALLARGNAELKALILLIEIERNRSKADSATTSTSESVK